MQNDIYYQAVLARDHRFDGKFFVGVKTTGIYCRPICPAKPKRQNVEFFSKASQAEKAGFRPCLRCRPEAAPLSPAWYGKSALVQRAIRNLEDFGMEGKGENEFATKFGVTARHLRRLFVSETGKTPRQFSADLRLDQARQWVAGSSVPITQVAFSSGFQSLRRFNSAFKTRFSKPPSAMRRSKKNSRSASIQLPLSYRPPYDWKSVLTYLKRHEVYGIETIHADAYERCFSGAEGPNRVRVEHDPQHVCLKVSFQRFERHGLPGQLRAIRRLFDLDADPLLVSNAFENSKFLSGLDRRYPGMRSLGCWDPFETAVAIILGQLVSSQVARKLMGQLVQAYGNPIGSFFSMPTPETLSNCTLKEVSTTAQRKDCIRELSRLVANGSLALHAHQDTHSLKSKLASIRGIGPWTLEYIGMRCLGEPDAFPKTDLILGRLIKTTPALNLESVRPWRAYACHKMWRYSAEQSAPAPEEP